ncbi:MAG TPA: carboxypeptidase regulatory-like domain-containing protein [Gemmatimonadales bacterium]|jgi:carboxypeptidase family protein|nr:carboxypeptidase regulatory-like domain-containing protein [Gemmatimonadales bacterium]
MRLRQLLILLLPAAATAQRADSTVTLIGRVRDEVDSGAVAHATINVLGTSLVAAPDGKGQFRIDGIQPGTRELVIRALGYAKLIQSEELPGSGVVRRDYYMKRVPHVLTEMVVLGRAMRVPRGMEEIYRRGARGWGTFITREQIDSLDPIDIKALLATIPGVYTNDRGVAFQRCPAFWRPQLWIDGQRVTRFMRQAQDDRHSLGPTPDPYFLNEQLTELLPRQVQAMEVYTSNSSTPAEFMDGSGCGTIAIWTLRGP